MIITLCRRGLLIIYASFCELNISFCKTLTFRFADYTGGKSVTVEYSREDGSKVQCSYLHLSDIAVKVGDVVNAVRSWGCREIPAPEPLASICISE